MNGTDYRLTSLFKCIALFVLQVCNVAPTMAEKPATEQTEPASKQQQDVSGKDWIELQQNKVDRDYLLYTPESYSPDQPAALVVVLHGGHGNAERVAKQTGFVPIADRNGFLLAFPQAQDENWNDGRQVTASKFDDVSYITSVVDDVVARRAIDINRVYVTGISNGGMMTQRLACDATDRFAAFASVVANLPASLESTCRPSQPVKIMMINGNADPLMPYRGGEIKKGRRSGKGGTVLSTRETAEFWAAASRCDSSTEKSELPDKDPRDGTRISKTQFTNCADSTAVVLYSIDGGGHAWPGSPVKQRFLITRLTGTMSKDISASEVIWNFFAER